MPLVTDDIRTMQTDVLESAGDGYKSLQTFSAIPAMSGILYSEDGSDALERDQNVRKVDLGTHQIHGGIN